MPPPPTRRENVGGESSPEESGTKERTKRTILLTRPTDKNQNVFQSHQKKFQNQDGSESSSSMSLLVLMAVLTKENLGPVSLS